MVSLKRTYYLISFPHMVSLIGSGTELSVSVPENFSTYFYTTVSNLKINGQLLKIGHVLH